MTVQEPIIETKNLTKFFGAMAAVNDVSIKIQAGTLHAIIGPNGAGKTTFFNFIEWESKTDQRKSIL